MYLSQRSRLDVPSILGDRDLLTDDENDAKQRKNPGDIDS